MGVAGASLDLRRPALGTGSPRPARSAKLNLVLWLKGRNLGSWTPVSRIGGGRERIRNRFLTFKRNFRRRTAGRGTQIAKPPNREGRRLCIEPLGRGAPTLSPSCVEKGQRPGPIKKAYARRSPPQAVFFVAAEPTGNRNQDQRPRANGIGATSGKQSADTEPLKL